MGQRNAGALRRRGDFRAKAPRHGALATPIKQTFESLVTPRSTAPHARGQSPTHCKGQQNQRGKEPGRPMPHANPHLKSRTLHQAPLFLQAFNRGLMSGNPRQLPPGFPDLQPVRNGLLDMPQSPVVWRSRIEQPPAVIEWAIHPCAALIRKAEVVYP